MKTPQNPTIDLPDPAYRHLIHTLIAQLPPPIENTPEATAARNHAAIARIAALAPANANEAELAAQCVAARAQAEDILRLIRLHAADIELVIKLNAQYATMVRTSLALNNHLRREQQQRRKRETNHGAADIDVWARQVVANTMLLALPDEPKIDPQCQIIKNETIERRPTNQVINLRSTPPKTLDQTLSDPDNTIPDLRRIIH